MPMPLSERRTHIEKLTRSGGLPASPRRSATVDPAASPRRRCIVCGDPGLRRILWQSEIIKEPLLCVECFELWLEMVRPEATK